MGLGSIGNGRYEKREKRWWARAGFPKVTVINRNCKKMQHFKIFCPGNNSEGGGTTTEGGRAERKSYGKQKVQTKFAKLPNPGRNIHVRRWLVTVPALCNPYNLIGRNWQSQ